MKKVTKVLAAVSIATTIFTLTYSAGGTGINNVKERFNLEISMADRPPFTLSVVATDGPSALLPVSTANAYAIKVVPTIQQGSLKLSLLAVLDKLPEIPTCDNIKTLKTASITSYAARDGDLIRVSDFEKMGIAPFTLKVVSLATNETACPNGACCCGNMTCYPNPGRCIECGSCGLCCKSGEGLDSQ